MIPNLVNLIVFANVYLLRHMIPILMRVSKVKQELGIGVMPHQMASKSYGALLRSVLSPISLEHLHLLHKFGARLNRYSQMTDQVLASSQAEVVKGSLLT